MKKILALALAVGLVAPGVSFAASKCNCSKTHKKGSKCETVCMKKKDKAAGDMKAAK